METSLWKLSTGFGPSFLETGWLARQFPRIHMAIGNSALDFSSVSWKPAGWLRRGAVSNTQLLTVVYGKRSTRRDGQTIAFSVVPRLVRLTYSPIFDVQRVHL